MGSIQQNLLAAVLTYTYEPHLIRFVPKTTVRPKYFVYGPNKWLVIVLLYISFSSNFRKFVGKFLKNFQYTDGTSNITYFIRDLMKTLSHNSHKFSESFVDFSVNGWRSVHDFDFRIYIFHINIFKT